MTTAILDGIRIIDLTQALAGPYCTKLLGDFGADVIKIERPGSGDQSRAWGPPFVEEESVYFMGTNYNKRSVTLNLKAEAGQAVLHRLIETADVLIHNVPRAGSRQRLGIDADTVMARNPHIVWVSISGFGLSGPDAEKPGYDVIAQAMSGTMGLTGEPEQGPVRFPTPMADITTGLYATIAIIGALYERRRSGEGQVVDLALLDSQITWLANVASAYLATGEPPQKRGNTHPNIAPYQPFEAADGWFILAAGTERHWQRLLEVLDAEERLGQDPRFATNADRVEHREALERALQRYFRGRSVTDWIGALEEAGIPCGPIHRPEQALTYPQILARDMVLEMEHPSAGTVRVLGNPIKMSRSQPALNRPAPRLGEHTDEILQGLGYQESQITALREAGVI